MRTESIRFALAIVLLCPFASAQWARTTLPDSSWVDCFAVSGTNLFAGTRSGGVFLSTNNGTSWTATGLTNTDVLALAVSGTNLLAGTYPLGGVFLSTDNGASWNPMNTGLSNGAFVKAFAVSGTNIFAGSWDGVFLSTNNGTSWTAVNKGLVPPYVDALAVSGTNLFAGTSPMGYVYLSTDYGTNWNQVSGFLPPAGDRYNPISIVLAASGENLFAGIVGSPGGVFLSTNDGTNWTAVDSGLTNLFIMALLASGANLIAGTEGGVFLSTNNGTTWTAAGLTNSFVTALAVSGGNLMAGTDAAGVWRRPLSQMITALEDRIRALPSEFSLSQNYPNPFNPTTVIRYQIPKTGHVTLMLYNTLGQEVTTLVNAMEEPGYKSVQFDGSRFSSGVYFYRLQAGDFIQTKKLLSLR